MTDIKRLARFLVRRLLFSIPVFFGVTIIVWALIYSAGDPVALMLIGQPNITQEVVDHLRAYYRLDRPIWEQYFYWLANLVQGNFGLSFRHNQPVLNIILPWAMETLKLQLTALIFAVILAIFIGVYSARHPYSVQDMGVTAIALFGVSTPIFVLGIFGILIFSFYLYQWTNGLMYFPSSGAHSWYANQLPLGVYLVDAAWHMVLPTLVLTFTFLALYVRLIRSGMRETLEQDYVLAARASGLSERRVIYKHALRNALIPLVTFLGIAVALAFAGAPITETVFTWPGLGYFYIVSLTYLDVPSIMAIITIITRANINPAIIPQANICHS